jgi:cobalt-zinc-cadmium efflux system membrane fusion protein
MNARILAALLAALVAAGCKKIEATSGAGAADAQAPSERLVKFDAQALERLGVRSQVVGETNAKLTVEFPGSLEYAPEHYAEVGTLFEGRLTSANVKVGDRVKKGQVLATIAAPSLVSAQAEAISTKAAAEVAREHARREGKLLEAQLTTAREAEVAREGLVKAEADYNAATAKLALVGLGPTQARSGYGVAELRAPIDGVVVKREAIVGAHINTDETPFVVADGSNLVAAFDVFEGDLALVKENAEVELRVDALPGQVLKGIVARLEPQLGTETRAVRARVRLPNADGHLRPGFFVRVTVSAHMEQFEGRLRVPSGAVQPLGGEEVVFIERQPGVYEVRPVTVGHRYGQVSELISGLSGGERIVTSGAFILRSELSRQ